MPSYVPGIGPKNAKIMLVGEGPGNTELSKGEPFIGPAGKQLDRMLRAAGLDRNEIYITNVTKTRKQTFFEGGTPTQWYMDGILELIGEINSIKPNVVVPLGNFAFWALYQQQKITAWRGSILESTLVPGQKIIPTLHPAYYIKQGGFNSHKEPLGIWDFQRIKEESAFPEVRVPAPNIITDPSPLEIDQYVDILLQSDHITADTEWYSPDSLAYIGFSNAPDWAIVISPDSMKAYRAYKAILGSGIPKWWQNAIFDDVALDRIGIKVVNVVHDTMVMWHNCWTDLRQKDLGTITSVLTRHPYYKDDLEFVGRDERGQIYCGTDVVGTDESAQGMLNEEFEITGGRRGYNISMSIYGIMSDASKLGVRCDQKKLMELKNLNLEKANHIEDTLSDTLGYTINCRSPDQVRHLVYEQLGVARKKKTTRQEVLMDLAAATKDDQLKTILTAVVRVRQYRNMVSRYINEDIVDRDGRIRTNWNLAGTRSGRLSSTDPWWNGVALQTMPDEAREVCIADPGTVFLGWDLGQAEARVVAIKTRDFELLEDMERGIDIHTKLASQLPFGLTYDELVAKIGRLGKDNTPERVISKKCRHALNYVMGSTTFRYTVNRDYLETGIGVSEGEARRLRQAYLDLHTGLETWWNEVRDGLKSGDRRMTTSLGRVRTFIGWLNEQMLREAVSFEPQATVADLTTISIAAANERLKKIDPAAQFMAHMHDGGFVQVKEEVADEAVDILREEMTQEIIVDRQPLTIPVDLKKGYDWLNLEYI